MRLVQLSPKNDKAKKHLVNAGWPHHWIVLDEKNTIAFSDREGPWLHITPDNNITNQARWVNLHNDTDFLVREC